MLLNLHNFCISLDFGFGGMHSEMHGGPRGMGGMQSFSGFSNMSGGGISGFGSQPKDSAIEHNLPVSFDELLHGTTKKMKITRNVIVPGTNGTRPEQKVLEINVKKGWKEGTKVTFPNEGDQSFGRSPADIIFKIKDKVNESFSRDKDNNLIYKHKLSLKQALTGCVAIIPTLDGQSVTLDLKHVTPTSKRIVKGHGLPVPKNPSQRADLVVQFDIQFPKKLSLEQIAVLRDVLPD